MPVYPSHLRIRFVAPGLTSLDSPHTSIPLGSSCLQPPCHSEFAAWCWELSRAWHPPSSCVSTALRPAPAPAGDRLMSGSRLLLRSRSWQTCRAALAVQGLMSMTAPHTGLRSTINYTWTCAGAGLTEMSAAEVGFDMARPTLLAGNLLNDSRIVQVRACASPWLHAACRCCLHAGAASGHGPMLPCVCCC